MNGRKYAGQPIRTSSAVTSSRDASRTAVGSSFRATGNKWRLPAKWMISPWSVVARFGMAVALITYSLTY
jgi:hypothetical protein